MKIANSISILYNDQKGINEKLQDRVNDIIQSFKNKKWFYSHRIKTEESFALKLETGRVLDPSRLEDFFACTIVVENYGQIQVAVEEIEKYFEIFDRRPTDIQFTTKDSSSFLFDDLRLYVKLRKQQSAEVTPIYEVLFEIQVKTFLQHAWVIATHDLIYKTDDINWPKERIAYQIKALLEQAELTINSAKILVNQPELPKDNWQSRELKEILKFYQRNFAKVDLPDNLIGLCKNTKDLLKNIGLKTSDLHKILSTENRIGKGTNLKNLSPYHLIVQSIINQNPNQIEEFLKKEKSKFKIFVTKDVSFNSISLHGTNCIVSI